MRFLKKRPNVCVFTVVLGAVVSMYTLTLLLSQVDRQVFTSRIIISFYKLLCAAAMVP